MKYNYKGISYIIEYAVMSEEDFDIWLQHPENGDDFIYIENLPENVQDELHSLVLHDVLDSELQNEGSFVGYLD